MSKQKRKWTRVQHSMPEVGTELVGKYKADIYKARIVNLSEGKNERGISYKGKIYPSMTAAAKSITGNSTNGWRFWKISR